MTDNIILNQYYIVKEMAEVRPVKADLFKRAGLIIIGLDLLHNKPRFLMQVMGNVIPFAVIANPNKKMSEYYCYSPLFDAVANSVIDVDELPIYQFGMATVRGENEKDEEMALVFKKVRDIQVKSNIVTMEKN